MPGTGSDLSFRFASLLAVSALLVLLAAACGQPASPPAATAVPAKPAATSAPAKPAATSAPAKPAATTAPAKISYPTKPVTLIAWSAAGSKIDTVCRLIAKIGSPELGQTIVVENKEGGGGVMGVNELLSRPADGYTIAMVAPTLSTMFLEPGITFKPDDFTPIMFNEFDPFLIVVPASGPLKTFKDLIDFAKANPNKLKIGGAFATGNHRNHWESLAEAAGITGTWVPFDGSGQAHTAIAGAQLDAISSTDPAQAKQLMSQGKVRILAVSTEQRVAGLPDVPTYKEMGVNYTRTMWNGLVVKKGVPDQIVEKITQSLTKALQGSQEWKDYLKRQDALDGVGRPAKELMDAILKEMEDSARIKKKLGL